jgi:hypothetical protein
MQDTSRIESSTVVHDIDERLTVDRLGKLNSSFVCRKRQRSSWSVKVKRYGCELLMS